MQKGQQSKQNYLKNLGKRLIWFFPFGQVLEILTDYEGFFHTEKNENTSIESVIKSLGSPKEVLREILAESPGAKFYFFKWIGFWGILMLVSAYLLFYMEDGFWMFLFLFPLSLFGLMHGWEIWGLERQFPAEKTNKKHIFFAHCLIFVLTLLTEAAVQFLRAELNELPYETSVSIARNIDWLYICFQLVSLLLLLWMLAKTLFFSVSYYLGVLHASGGLCFFTEIRAVWHSVHLPMPEFFRKDFWLCLVCYVIFLGAAAFLMFSFRLWISKKEG